MNKLEAAQKILDGDDYEITKAGVSYANTGSKLEEYLEIKCSNSEDIEYFRDSYILSSDSDDAIEKVLKYSEELDIPYLKSRLLGEEEHAHVKLLNLNNINKDTFKGRSYIKTIDTLKEKGVDALLSLSVPLGFTMYYVSYNNSKIAYTIDPAATLEHGLKNPFERFYYNNVFRDNVTDLIFMDNSKENFKLNLFTHNNEGEDGTNHTTDHDLNIFKDSVANKLNSSKETERIIDKIKKHFQTGNEKSLLDCLKQLDNLTK